MQRGEGELEVRLDVADGRVTAAHIGWPAERRAESALVGLTLDDVLAALARGSVSQTVAAARAMAHAAWLLPPPNGTQVLDLMLGTEAVADHLSFFYLFFLPDFTRPVYAERPWFAEAERRYAALTGQQTRKAITARQRWLEQMAALGGKPPHVVRPGGAAPIEAIERPRLLARLRELRSFIERELVAAPLDELLAIDSLAALERWRAADPARGDLRLWLTIALDTGLAQLGRGPGRLLSVGSFWQPDGRFAVPRGLWQRGQLQPLNVDALTEDATQAWLHGERWSRAPRQAGKVVESGALARQAASGQPLLRDALARLGSNVFTRVLARLFDLIATVTLMEQALAALQPREPFCSAPGPQPAQGEGLALVETARGALGHWLRIEKGRIADWLVIAPTRWHFSPRDASGQPGAVEAALEGAPLLTGESGAPIAAQHVVRSFDPGRACALR